MKNNVIIIGNGFIGSKLNSYFQLIENSDLKVFSYSLPDYFNIKNCINSLENKLMNTNVSYIINCVGYTGSPNVDGCEINKNDTWYLNVTWPLLLANIAERLNIKVINISSGCIYDGYEKEFTELDTPNFGLWNPDASWYSKTKHACELSLQNYSNVFNFRIRMPITGNLNEKKNYLTKILRYNNLIDFQNSKTVVEDLLEFTYRFILLDRKSSLPSGNYNVVNPLPLKTKEVVDILDEYGFWNPNWKWVSLEEMYKETTCKRSNCVLSTSFIESVTDIIIPSEETSLRRILENAK